MAVQNFRNAFKNLPIVVKVLIGEQDVTDDVQDFGEISFLNDDEIVGQYSAGEFRFVLLSPDERWNPESSDNFFAENSLAEDGIGVSVEVHSAYGRGGTPIWYGKIVSLVFYAADGSQGNEGLATITATDISENLDEPITDFGTPKRFHLIPKVERQGVSRGNGIYPVLPAILPPSDQSSKLHLSLSELGNLKEQLRTEGDLDAKNFIVSDNGVETEGGQLTGLTTAFPQIEAKFPYRYEPVGHLINAITSKFNIPQHTVVLFLAKLGEHFSSNGRIGYNSIGNSGQEYDRNLSFEGFPTTRQVIGNNEYTLYTTNGDDTYNKSRVLKYSHTDLEETIVYSFDAGVEVYDMALLNDNEGYFLVRDATDHPRTYNTGRAISNTSVRILKINWSTNAVSTVVNRGSTYPVQGGCHYRSAAGTRWYAVPENRQGFESYNNTHLIYRWANATDFGVAALPIAGGAVTSLISTKYDGHENDMGCCFSIAGNELRVSFTWRSAVDSKSELYRVDLSSLS